MVKIEGNAVLGGEVHKHSLGLWTICWESKGDYRHWCIQNHPKGKYPVLVIAQNPGSLSGDGKNLTRDTTLRILREVFENTLAYPVVVNLFDFADPLQSGLYNNWEIRDAEKLIYEVMDYSQFSGVLYAYGDCLGHPIHKEDISERVHYIREACASLREVQLPLNLSGTPKHPIMYQRQKIKQVITKGIEDFLLS